MCGFAGLIDGERRTSASDLSHRAQQMAATLRHRGPDDEGCWVDAAAGIALGHRRLSIIDLSPRGHQPMISSSGRYVIAYNGEIYNFQELRSELESCGANFRGKSDTEVILEACERWGTSAALGRFNGMFAFALWDRQQRQILLARDRFGEKPLYYAWAGPTLLFASELKALGADESFERTIDRDALTLFFRYNCIPAPHTIYKNVFKLPPASYLLSSGERAQPQVYWPLPDIAEDAASNPWKGTQQEAMQELRSVLGRAVAKRMVSDVPLGSFLSGGVDSSSVVALMQQHSTRPIKTFSVGLSESDYNEAEQAKAVAAHLGTDHTELHVTPQQALATIPKLPGMYDEPFSDSSQIPTFLLCQSARTQVKVSLSGDGGDELFAGYNRYLWLERIWRRVGWLPTSARSVSAKMLEHITPDFIGKLSRGSQALVPRGRRTRMLADKLHKVTTVLESESAWDAYLRLASHWHEPDALVQGANEPEALRPQNGSFERDLLAQMMCRDSTTFLPDDVLTKVDRASMAVSLEVRCPFLDPEVFKFAWQLPAKMKICDGRGKWILRQLLYTFVPKQLVERPKMGFGIPLDSWLRGPLREWVEELLAPERLHREGFLNAAMVREKWTEHLSGKKNWQYHLWDALMFQAWLAEVGSPARQGCAVEGVV